MIESEWKKFCLACFGDISDQQYIDLRRTFYGGASSLFFLFMNVLDPGVEPTEADLEKVSALRNEMVAFNEAVKSGKA
jgi:hypothetical protein